MFGRCWGDFELFLGSYPITPASDILHTLSAWKHFGIKTFQAEDEIAGVTSAIGAAYAGSLAVTTTSSATVLLVRVTPKDSGSPKFRNKPLIDSES